jgi:thiol-disulfide isomerase/thioredoxin
MPVFNHLPNHHPRRSLLVMLAAGFTVAVARSWPNSAAASSSDDVSDVLDTMKPYQGTSPNKPLGVLVESGDGSMTSLNELIDRPMLVNLWASWCPACVHELPALVVLDQALEKAGMAVMLVGLDRKGRLFGEQFLADHEIKIPRAFYEKTDDLARALQIKAMPTSILVTPKDGIIGVIEGPLDWQDPAVIVEVRAALSS